MDYSKLGTAAAESDDLTQAKSYERELPRAGVALLRLKDYIETGRHESNNPAYKPSLKSMLTFELCHPDHMVEFDGVKEPALITLRLNKGTTAKSGYRKLFSVMNLASGGEYQHFIQMIGKPFLGEVFHNAVGEGDNKKTYANLDREGAWSLKAPMQVDALTNVSTPIPVPEMSGEPRVFLWDNASLDDSDVEDMWATIYIEGEREHVDKATGEKSMVSKNWIQEIIMKNIEWEGSREQALTQEHISLDGDEAEPEELKDLPTL
jgi:hypothetical protein